MDLTLCDARDNRLIMTDCPIKISVVRSSSVTATGKTKQNWPLNISLFILEHHFKLMH